MELKFDPNKPPFEFVTDSEEAKKAVEDLSKSSVIALDTEASELDPYTAKVLLIQIAKEDKAYVFDSRKVDCTIFKDLLEIKPQTPYSIMKC